MAGLEIRGVKVFVLSTLTGYPSGFGVTFFFSIFYVASVGQARLVKFIDCSHLASLLSSCVNI